MRILFLVFLFILGACLGSFLCCQARRLRLREQGTKHLKNRSFCFHCRKPLKWYHNLPIISWLILRGRCASCHAKIGRLEILSELGLAVAFLLLGCNFDFVHASPLGWPLFLLSLIFTCLLAFLAIYDAAYGELPTVVLTISIICAIIILTLKLWASFSTFGWSSNLITDPIISVLILSGTYLALYLISKGQWVGDGDWLLALALALALASPWLALLTLCFANLLACFVTLLPALLKKRHKSLRGAQIPLGPFLISAFVIIYSFANFFTTLL